MPFSPYRETIFSRLKLGLYSTRRYPWGSSKGPAMEGRPSNDRAIVTAHYNFFTTANQSKEALPQNDLRRFMQIQNMSLTDDIVFLWGGNASLNDGVTLTPGQVEIFDVSVPIEKLYIFCAAGAQRVALIEGY